MDAMETLVAAGYGAPDPEADFVDLEAPRKRSAGEDDKALTLTIADERDGRLSPAAAKWVHQSCALLAIQAGLREQVPEPPLPVKVRIQRNVKTGEVFLLPSIDDGITVRTHRGAPLPRRFYVLRLLRTGLVRPKQVVKLRVSGNRLVLIGVKAPV